ncbi:MAG: hypothetical protein GKR95_14040 [Gammaproteobacteria bacterium]|nr:hypothetical protein [Gammaproteobacteria bacterium]NKB63183.1 hypothetical protein [Gammaproteobacteria bacterium]
MKSSPSELYHKLPKADSPDHLDHRILATAQQFAPHGSTPRVRRWLVSWLPITTMACVIGLTVMIVQPGFEATRQQEVDSAPPLISAQSGSIPSVETELMQDRVGRSYRGADSSEIMAVDQVNQQPVASVLSTQSKPLPSMAMAESAATSTMRAKKSPAPGKFPQQFDALNSVEVLLTHGEVRLANAVIQHFLKMCPTCQLPESLPHFMPGGQTREVGPKR